ncbi:hypothetical protein [Nostoc sp. DSM 114161]|uniref:hypothetical protein n=1 Tax=Nostoc sp. DSM 114161 TaxID=3440143 RepID=UPI004045CB44
MKPISTLLALTISTIIFAPIVQAADLTHANSTTQAPTLDDDVPHRGSGKR